MEENLFVSSARASAPVSPRHGHRSFVSHFIFLDRPPPPEFRKPPLIIPHPELMPSHLRRGAMSKAKRQHMTARQARQHDCRWAVEKLSSLSAAAFNPNIRHTLKHQRVTRPPDRHTGPPLWAVPVPMTPKSRSAMARLAERKMDTPRPRPPPPPSPPAPPTNRCLSGIAVMSGNSPRSRQWMEHRAAPAVPRPPMEAWVARSPSPRYRYR